MRPSDVVGAFFIRGVAFFLAAAAVGIAQWIAPWPSGHWLALHLAFVGGVSQLILGASQFFAGAFLATDPPPRLLVRAQIFAWNAGAILLAIAVPDRADALAWLAIGLLVGGLVVWGAAVATMRRRSLRRSPWATCWYLSGACFFGLGMIASSLLARRVAWSHGDLLAAHMALNLLLVSGWIGLTVLGSLAHLLAVVVRVRGGFAARMPAARPRLDGFLAALAMVGVASLALSQSLGLGGLGRPAVLALLAAYAILAARIAVLSAPVSLKARPRL